MLAGVSAGCRDAGADGGIWADRGSVTLNDSTVTENTATGPTSVGGGIFSEAGGSVILNDSSVTDDTVTGDNSEGGGIFVVRSSLTLNGSSSITGNTASGVGADGGGIWNLGTATGATAANITGNQPDNCGGVTVPGCSN